MKSNGDYIFFGFAVSCTRHGTLILKASYNITMPPLPTRPQAVRIAPVDVSGKRTICDENIRQKLFKFESICQREEICLKYVKIPTIL